VRIVSLVPAGTEIACALGAGDDVSADIPGRDADGAAQADEHVSEVLADPGAMLEHLGDVYMHKVEVLRLVGLGA